MRDDTRSRCDVLDHLEAENAYVEAVLAGTRTLRATLTAELTGRLKPDDESVPVKDGAWWYGSRFVAGSEYPLYFRRDAAGVDHELLDVNREAASHFYYNVGDLQISPDDRYMAFTEDTVSRRQYTLRVRDLATGEDLPDRIRGIEPSVVWVDHGTTLLYVEQDPETLLGVRVRAHVLGTDPSEDRLVFENTDDSFYLDVRRSLSRRYIFIHLDATDTTETLFAPAGDPALAFRSVCTREQGHEYHVDHLGDDFVIRTNSDAPNFRVVRVPVGQCADRDQWTEVVPHDPNVFIEAALPLVDHLVLDIRAHGLLRVRAHPWAGGTAQTVPVDDPASTVAIGANREQDAHLLRYVYTALTTPASDMQIDLRTGERVLLKRAFAGVDFDPTRYVSDVTRITARDGTQVPVSLLRATDTPLDGSAPLLQYAYGSYGISMDPSFRGSWLSLVDRGFVVAIAHIRGGQELGREWYESGRQQSKRNSFTDFIDVTRALVADQVCDPGKVFAMGGSAGGLLMGAVANMAPADYRGIIAQVPFVDVVTTMLDESIPLTTNEYDEWGNPEDRDDYMYMLGYSPYDNVVAQDYPAMLVMTGLHDSQVQFWEPAKWVARLRRIGTGDAPTLFHTRMEAGHGGASGRYRAFEDTALVYAFILDQLGIAE